MRTWRFSNKLTIACTTPAGSLISGAPVVAPFAGSDETMPGPITTQRLVSVISSRFSCSRFSSDMFSNEIPIPRYGYVTRTTPFAETRRLLASNFSCRTVHGWVCRLCLDIASVQADVGKSSPGSHIASFFPDFGAALAFEAGAAALLCTLVALLSVSGSLIARSSQLLRRCGGRGARLPHTLFLGHQIHDTLIDFLSHSAPHPEPARRSAAIFHHSLSAGSEFRITQMDRRR